MAAHEGAGPQLRQLIGEVPARRDGRGLGRGGLGPGAREGARREHRRHRHPALRGRGQAGGARDGRDPRAQGGGRARAGAPRSDGHRRHPGPHRDRGRGPPCRARRGALPLLRRHRRRGAAGDRGLLRARPAPQPPEREGLPGGAGPAARGPARRRVRHRVPPDDGAGGVPLRAAVRPLPAARHPALRLPRHVAPVRLAPRRGAARPGRRPGTAARHLPPRQRLLASRPSAAAGRSTPRWASRPSRASSWAAAAGTSTPRSCST